MQLFSEFLNEEAEKINIEKYFDMFNKNFFSGKLVKNFKLKWNRSKLTSGNVVVIGNKREASNYWTIKELTLSYLIAGSENEQIEILLHEMCHVALIQRGISDPMNPHDIVFKKELNRVRSAIKSKYPDVVIPDEEDDVTNKKVSDKIKGKEYLVGIISIDDKITGLQVFTVKNKDKVIDDVKEFPIGWWKSTKITYKFYLSDSNQLAKYKVMRKAPHKNFSYFDVTKDLIDEIMKNGKEIKFENPK